MSLLDIRDLRKRYDATDALKGISFSVERGEVFGLLGPNGAGKSTTINILLGLILADSGGIRIFDLDFATRQIENPNRAPLRSSPRKRSAAEQLRIIRMRHDR